MKKVFLLFFLSLFLIIFPKPINANHISECGSVCGGTCKPNEEFCSFGSDITFCMSSPNCKTPTPIPTIKPTSAPTSAPTSSPGTCSGSVSLSLNPTNPVKANDPVKATATKLFNCNNKLITFRVGSCNGTSLGPGCLFDLSVNGCTGTFGAPALPTQVVACIDKNGDINFVDPGEESNSVFLNIGGPAIPTSPPAPTVTPAPTAIPTAPPTPTRVPRLPPCLKWEYYYPKAKLNDPEFKKNNTPIPTDSQDYIKPDFQDRKCVALQTAIGEIGIEPKAFVARIFGLVLGLSAGISLILIILSGYKFMTTGGNPESFIAARDMLVSAIVGLLFIIFSFVILQIIGVDILRIPGFG